MTYAAVYRSTHPDVLARLARFNTERRAWSERVEALWRDAGFPEGSRVWISAGGLAFGDRVAGIQVPRGAKAPKGWTSSEARSGRYLPNRGSKVGREAQGLLDAVGRAPGLGDVLTDTGMPTLISYGLGLRQPAFKSHGTPAVEVWVGWSIDPDAVEMERQARGNSPDADPIDAEHWERVQLSEFWALVEGGRKPLPLGDGDDEDRS